MTHESVLHVVCGESLLRAKVKRVLWDQYKAGIWSIIKRFGPGVAESTTNVMTHSLLEVHQQAVELRIPSGISLEEKKICTGRSKLLFASCTPTGIMQSANRPIRRLINVVEA